jgi:hypothetical protein
MRFRLAWSWSWQARGGIRALGAAMALAGLGTLGVGTASGAAPAQQAQQQDPLALFSVMMPVFSSPRCVNCHGGTNPQTELNHEGGQVDVPVNEMGDMKFDPSGACLECHTAAPPSWRLAPSHMSFVGRDAVALCRQLRTINGLSDAAKRTMFVDHLSGDALIGLAFVGQGAIGPESAFAPISPEPPPMTQEDFVGAAQNWVSAGQALCGLGWSGTITVTKTASHHEITQGNTVERDSALEIKDTIDLVEGEATGTTHLAQHDYQDSGPKNHNCGINHVTWAVDGKGPADVQIFVSGSSAADESGLSAVQLFISVPQATGTMHTDLRTGPLTACRQNLLKDEPFTVMQDHLDARGPADPNDPNNLEGDQTTLSPDKTITTTIKWKLTRPG